MTKVGNRRNFIKKAGILTGALWLYNPLFKSFASHLLQADKSIWIDLLHIAKWCPSVHNLQPHLIKPISAEIAELYYEPKRLLPHGDPQSIFATVAMGILIENLSIVAAKLGKEVVIEKVFDPISVQQTQPTLFARLRLQPRSASESLAVELIAKRRTSRIPYQSKPVPEKCLSSIQTECSKHQQEFFYSSDETLVEAMIKMNQETLFEDLASKENCAELDHLFRYSAKEANAKKFGLSAACMGFSGKLIQSVFHHPEIWQKGKRRKLLSWRYQKSFHGTQCLGWFGGEFNTVSDWLNCGKVLARNWLISTQHGCYIQPFGSLITNKNAYTTINQIFQQPSKGKTLWFVFRIGFSKQPARSLRLETHELILA